MRKYLIILFLVLSFATSQSFAAENLNIAKRGKQTITFDPIEVSAGSIESQFVIIKSNISKIFTNTTGFADIGGSYGKYKRQLPITSTFDNPAHHFTVSIAYSENDKSIICLQECWNSSDEDYEFPELEFDLEWYLLKNKSF